MLIFILALAVPGLFVWAIRTKNYAAGFVGAAFLFASVSFFAGLFEFDHDRPWPGMLMVAVSIAALLSSAALAMRLRSKPGKHQAPTSQ